MPKVILISGKARHGKDCFAQAFEGKAALNGKKCLIIKYADILKFICMKYFYWDGEKDNNGRTLLQYVGTDLARVNNPNIWVNCVIEIVKGLKTEFDYILIPDTRFPNEIQEWMGKEFDYISVRVNRLNEDKTPFDNGLSQEQKSHPSETALDGYVFDYVVNNIKLEDIVRAANDIYEEVRRM